ncbi:hypothetical protein Q7P37_009846 [Cladosporium fusiforme]
MSSRPPCNELAGALVPIKQANDETRSFPPDACERPEQGVLQEVHHLLMQSLSNDDVCLKILNDSWASSSDWYRRIFEQVMSSRQAIEQRLFATRQQLSASQAALHQEVASCATLQQALAAEQAKSAAYKEKMDEMSVRHTLCKGANTGLVEANARLGEANAHLSRALYNLTSLDDSGVLDVFDPACGCKENASAYSAAERWYEHTPWYSAPVSALLADLIYANRPWQVRWQDIEGSSNMAASAEIDQQDMESSKHATGQPQRNAHAVVEKHLYEGSAVPQGPHDSPLMEMCWPYRDHTRSLIWHTGHIDHMGLIESDRSNKRCKNDPPTPFPRFPETQLPPFEDDGDQDLSLSPSSVGLNPVETGSPWLGQLPNELSQVIEAVTSLRDDVQAMYGRPEPPTHGEVMDAIVKPCDAITRSLLAAKETYNNATKRTEADTKAQLAAGIAAFLHSWQ